MKIASPDELIGPCAGFKVLDFTTMVSGPLCGQNLGDLGADVIKIETLMGDTARWLGPPERAGLQRVGPHCGAASKAFPPQLPLDVEATGWAPAELDFAREGRRRAIPSTWD